MEIGGFGDSIGRFFEEAAFYDALAENGSAKQLMKSDTLRLMARELAEMVKKMPKLDWTQRESVRANLRRSVRRLLAKYGRRPGDGSVAFLDKVVDWPILTRCAATPAS